MTNMGDIMATTTPELLVRAVVRFQDARPALREPMRQATVTMAKELANERDKMKSLLDKRWDWCWVNESSPLFVEREDALLKDLKEYEAMEDALRMAAAALFGEAA